MPEKVFAISPTRIVGAALFVRCLISPGLSIIIKSVGSMSPIAKIFLLLYIISVVVAGCGTGNIASVIAISAALTTFVIVAALVYQINDSRWVALAIITGLLLASSYYILIWSGFLSPILIARISPTGQESLRITASRSSLNYTGSLMSVCFASLVFAYLSGSYKRKRIIALGLSLFVFTTMMDVGSRGAIVASIFGLFAAIVLAAKTRGIQGMYRTLGLFLASIIFVVIFWSLATSEWAAVFSRFTSGGELHGEGRLAIWSKAFVYVLSHPVIPDPRGWELISPGVGPHQSFLAAGMSGGLLAMVGLVGLAITTIRRGWKKVRIPDTHEQFWQCIFFLILVTLVINLCSSAMPGHKILWSMFAVCGTSFGRYNEFHRPTFPLV